MKLIVGLGNPGSEYKNTRHNLGFMVLDSLSEKLNFKIDKKKFSGLYAEIIIAGEKVIFLKPQKYMNLSGEVIKDFINYYKIEVKDVIVVHDDLDLQIGKYKLKAQGGSGGHNGLKDIESHLKTDTFNRLKIGVSNDKSIETKDYVLGTFLIQEMILINNVINEIKPILLDFIKEDMLFLMNRYNKK